MKYQRYSRECSCRAVSIVHEQVRICCPQRICQRGIHEEEIISKKANKVEKPDNYPQIIKLQLKKYMTDMNIAEMKSAITRFAQLTWMILSQWADELDRRIFFCRGVHKAHEINEIFIEGLDVSIRESMCECWG